MAVINETMFMIFNRQNRLPTESRPCKHDEDDDEADGEEGSGLWLGEEDETTDDERDCQGQYTITQDTHTLEERSEKTKMIISHYVQHHILNCWPQFD